MKKTNKKFRELISIVKDTNTNNRGDTTATMNDNDNSKSKPPANTIRATELDNVINAMEK